MNDEKEKESGFLSRWSDRKAAVRGGQINDLGDISEQVGIEPPTVKEQIPAEDAVVPDDLPDIETLNKDSDFTLFMREGTPEHLKRLALKKLFHSDPAFAVLDGLNDYDEDYSMIGMVAEAVSTRYQPGKGMFDPDDEIPGKLESEGEPTEKVDETETLDKEKLEAAAPDLCDAEAKDNEEIQHVDQRHEKVGLTETDNSEVAPK